MKFQDLLDGKLTHMFELETGITYKEDGFIQWYPTGGPDTFVVVVWEHNEFEVGCIQHTQGDDDYHFVTEDEDTTITFNLTDEVLVKRYRKVLDDVG